LFATYSARLNRDIDTDVFFGKLLTAADRQRYETAQTLDQVQNGLWTIAAGDYARDLLQANRKDDALAVLQNIITVAPFDYEAQIALVENAKDVTLARGAATSIYNNSEDPELAAKAARYLGRRVPDIGVLSALAKDEGGLHVVLIALPPCDPRLLADAAAQYEKIAGITVQVVRLSEHWEFDRPGRIPDQRRIQQAIIQKRGPNVNFNGWSRDRYKTELLDTVTASDALTKFNTEQFVEKLDARPDQYDAGPYLNRLAGILAQYRSTDNRAIYVGVTGADLFSGDTNYVFGSGIVVNGAATNLVSYYRMTSKSTGERYESRKRLTERLAKQLVPPTLGALGIARPVDPTDPYSYADSVARVDEKTLTLSEPTKQALDKLR
jgi:predicted Zn-dependent protease